MKVTFLGTGTSYGVPIIGCQCPVCTSTQAEDNRLRSSVLFTVEDTSIIIDVGPDFRQQMLRCGVDKVDAILITHEHKDHTAGLDDIRAISNKMNQSVPVYGLERVLNNIKTSFEYAFSPSPYQDLPRMTLIPIDHQESFKVNNISIIPVPVIHGKLPITGYRINDVAYITDTSFISEESLQLIAGVKVLIINALQHQPHPTHFSLKESLSVIEKVNASKNYLTHISHHFGLHHKEQAALPKNVYLAFDNLTVYL